MKNIFKTTLCATLMLLGLGACKDLDTKPYVGEVSELVYQDVNNYKLILAKLYAGLAVSGIKPKDDDVDLKNYDGGSQGYMRVYWYLQEFPTDEAVTGWGDPGLPDLHKMSWTASNQWSSAFYSRILFQAAVANEFLRETTDEKLSSRGIANSQDIKNYRAEARFIRALVYYHGIDLFGNIPLVTEKDQVGSALPKQATRQELFTYLEGELKALEAELPAPKTNEYGRADQAAAWMTLAKLYLNAEVYVGQKKYTEAAEYAKKVVDAGYTLAPKYAHNFLADNDSSPETIFTINFDGNETQTWGGTTTLIHAAVGGSMNPTDFGVDGGWAGFRTTKELVGLFDDKKDTRAMFYSTGQTLEIDNITTFTEGYAVTKWKNIKKDGTPGKNLTHTDTDFAVYRLADAYLMYAEAVLRGGNGDTSLALELVNRLRTRAEANKLTVLTLDNLLNERGRELFWEAHRRTDLIRFGKFTSGYNWAWKGGEKSGKDVEDFRTLYPIAGTDLVANPSLVQNKGY
ncbi:RagB/SusD family nutrient uptake outer membrane protein [Dyadobacter tibetensis]|uniref:RagB/SusD family nutrient uptake outer membrane protein n=1 Tax=Dyadobacter tibetensis TaxID=1211851 RepID=UPI00047210B1|nr:RagB/SusD family nutrient uptake outer membrane protein [Dyadobacter tibetensis]